MCLCLTATGVRQECGLRGGMRFTVLSHIYLCKPWHSHHRGVDAVPQPYNFHPPPPDWKCFPVSSDWLTLRLAPNNHSCPTQLKYFNQPDCSNLSLHTTWESNVHRCESWHSATSPTLNSKVTYQPRFFWLQPAPAWMGCCQKAKVLWNEIHGTEKHCTQAVVPSHILHEQFLLVCVLSHTMSWNSYIKWIFNLR